MTEHLHILDTRWTWLQEFGAALTRQTPTTCWCPDVRLWDRWRARPFVKALDRPDLPVHHFPLIRGYMRWPIRRLAGEPARIVRRLHAATPPGAAGTLIATFPFYVDVAERWDGPVVYYVTDRFEHYPKGFIYSPAMEAGMCRRADLVFANSRRIADFLVGELGCVADSVHVLPNATRQTNILPEPALRPGPLPTDAADLPRPVIGVIGNLASNMDWTLLDDVVRRTPRYSWLFVGPTAMPCASPGEDRLRDGLKRRGGRVRFVGGKPYGELAAYARAIDAAFLPYKKREPTYSGSSTRYYEHLAACRPMLATPGFEELLLKEPLLSIVRGADDAVARLAALAARDFKDDLETARWEESRQHTWERRAARMLELIRGLPTAYKAVRRRQA